MPLKIQSVTESFLRSVTLPIATNSYTVISHGFIIDNVKQHFQNNNLTVLKESYSVADRGNIAHGTYMIKPVDDTELGIMFSWVNSYNKKLRFECIAGATASPSLPYAANYVTGNMGSFIRKHTGNADQEAAQHIYDQIDKCSLYYNNMVAISKNFKNLILGKNKHSEILGFLYFIDKFLSHNQASIISKNIKDPMLPGLNSLWDLYTHIAIALRTSHPLDWISDHVTLHTHMSRIFKELSPTKDLEVLSENNPNQLDLFELEESISVDTNKEEIFYDL